MSHSFDHSSGEAPAIRTRFAPSPTGFLHIGGARTALFCWLAARASGGEFILRVEDTDRERSTAESVQAILDGLAWLELDPDAGPFYQSERMHLYRSAVARLLDEGKAYRCYCSRERLEKLREASMERGEKPRYDGHCRHLDRPPEGVEPVIRFRNPDSGTVAFRDRVRGPIAFDNRELDDLVIQRTDGTPTYNFAVVVDDLDMRINLVIRGDDHINNTPRQINLYHALGAEAPEFGHVPMILGDDGARLSKRHGAVGVMAWRELGYLPDAMVNYLARLGWSHGDREHFSRAELIELFRIEDVNRKASRFDVEKLNWLNQHYLRTAPAERVAPELDWHLRRAGLDPAAGPPAADLVKVQAERCETVVEMVQQSRPFYADFDEFDPGAAKKHLRPVAAAPLQAVRDRLVETEWTPEALGEAVRATAEALEIGMGKIGQPLRVALMGHGQSPSIDQTLWLVGRDRALARIDRALAFIAERAATSG
ncbi:MAG: glutamate--tRNA ligase [Wenzhouxiangellaceae bacterium]|nr:glutamate--tRNA ligase [Wenzhouxiangellaceae bacterium]MBS3746821.1 glutamate--tRNA ligase [Wenzhouxiangellaceae bacterium]MBS3823340.1 glutamate--tRNA ligase [Wenzhouxiangellaceae bacterium]